MASQSKIGHRLDVQFYKYRNKFYKYYFSMYIAVNIVGSCNIDCIRVFLHNVALNSQLLALNDNNR
jgi:hypothetical protein